MIAVLAITVVIWIWGIASQSKQFVAHCAPLELYHLTLLSRLLNFPQLLSAKNREKLKACAKDRVAELRERAHGEISRSEPKNQSENIIINAQARTMERLLCTAATNLGHSSSEIPRYEARLKEDWFTEPEHLKGRGVDFLARYLPYRLAQEVHQLVESVYMAG